MTPRTVIGDYTRDKGNPELPRLTLTGQVKHWPTPDTGHERSNRSVSPNAAVRPNIALAAAQWPTPASRDYRTPNHETLEERGGGGKGEQLPNFVAHHFPLHQGPTTPGGPPSSTSGPNLHLRLSPIFSAWLMGWPLTWAIAEPHASSASATALWRQQQRQLLSSLCGEPAQAD